MTGALGQPVPALLPGDCLGLIAPAGPAEFDHGAAHAWAERHGYRLKIFPGVPQAKGYLAGSDAVRLDDLHAAFVDPDIAAILCVRGGYGSPRLLDQIDYSLIANNPKPFVGYSDITALHQAILLETGCITFHGPMMRPDLLTPRLAPTETLLLQMLRGELGEGDCIHHPLDWPLTTLHPGVAEGRLVGGNLTMIGASLGTPWPIDTDGAVLFIEDVNEPLFRIDRTLNQLRLAGKFVGLRGVLLGDVAKIELGPLFELVKATFAELEIPILAGWRSGHCNPNLTLPLGARVVLDADSQRLTLAQSITR
ncbi:S66 peptidase family protein [Pseudomonas japonica]|uniref:S66 peptidase family protein n=1 Tax=Pseudomonas japonica TaxID=256466 RepID=UPI0015E31C85|nr:LD-carboxypeptidase [Pseudomonas japonica]MBA1290822.1 LD-carboxypeptidase [Pseudomonas japonica]